MDIRATMQIPSNTLHRRSHLAICSSRGDEAFKAQGVSLVTSAPPKSGKRSDLSRGEKRKLSLICGLSLVVAILSIARAAHSAAPTPTAPSERIFVKSEFVSTPGFGRDPFFPKSTRRGAPITTPTPTEVIPVPITSVRLNGISGPANRRLAILNYRTFAVGEEADIKIMSQIFRVKCVEIRDDVVVIIVNGQTQKLSLGPKF